MDFSIIMAGTSLVVALIALLYSVRMYNLKSKISIKSHYSIFSSSTSESKIISHIYLENLTDRSFIIFDIFLKIGCNNYILIESFENNPLILKPYEIFSREYDDIDFYSNGVDKVDFNIFLNSKNGDHQLVLSTSQGKYCVTSKIKKWDIYREYRLNHLMEIIYPMRIYYNDKSYGSNVKYLIDISGDDGMVQTFPIYGRNYTYGKLFGLDVTKDDLNTQRSIEKFLLKNMNAGLLKCNKFEIYNVDLWRNDLLHRYGKETISIKKYNFLSYFLFEKFKKLFFKSSRKYDTDLCSSILITPEMKYRIKKK